MAKKPYQLLVFDWDGTLMDSTGTIVMALQQAVADLGLPPPEESRCRYVIGMGLQEALAWLCPDLPEADHAALVARYRHHYLARDQFLALYDGVAECLPALREAGYTLAVATGKSRAGLNRVLARSDFGALFTCTRCADETRSKPDPLMLVEVMEETGFTPEQTLMIGDTTHDLLMAQHAGTDAFAVLYGAHPAPDLHALNPAGSAQHFNEFYTWLHGG